MFGKKRNKIDSKIRFQNPRFKKHLQTARGYKRPTRSIPQTDWGVFLTKIGLNNWKTRVTILVIFGVFFYIIYIPNFLFIKSIEVTGASTEINNSITESTNTYLQKKFPTPERNILLLSKQKLNNFLLNNNSNLVNINVIQKKFPSKLLINITPRISSLLLQLGDDRYLVSNDGLVLEKIYSSTTTPNTENLLQLKIDETNTLIIGKQILDQTTINFLHEVYTKLPNIIKSDIVSFELSTPNSSDLSIYTKKGYKIFIDLILEKEKTLSRLNLLFSQQSATEINKFYYVDMRFEGRGYVCFKDSACTRDIILPSQNSTNSLESILNTTYEQK